MTARHPWTYHPLGAFVDFHDATPELTEGDRRNKQMVSGRQPFWQDMIAPLNGAIANVDAP